MRSNKLLASLLLSAALLATPGVKPPTSEDMTMASPSVLDYGRRSLSPQAPIHPVNQLAACRRSRRLDGIGLPV